MFLSTRFLVLLRCQIGSIDPVRRIGGYLLRIGRFGAWTRRGKNSPWTRWDEPISGKISRVLRFASIWITKRFTSVRLSRRHGNARWRFHGRGPNSLSRLFLELLHSRNVVSIREPDGTRAFLRGTSWERRFLRAEPRYTRQSFLGRATVFPIPQLGISSFIFSFFYFVQVWLKIKLRGTTFLREFLNNCELSRILLLLLSTKSARWALS